MEYIVPILIGGIAGYLASRIMKGGRRFGLIGYVLLGIAGGMVGNFLFGLVDFVIDGVLGLIVTPMIGAIVLIWLARLIVSR